MAKGLHTAGHKEKEGQPHKKHVHYRRRCKINKRKSKQKIKQTAKGGRKSYMDEGRKW